MPLAMATRPGWLFTAGAPTQKRSVLSASIGSPRRHFLPIAMASSSLAPQTLNLARKLRGLCQTQCCVASVARVLSSLREESESAEKMTPPLKDRDNSSGKSADPTAGSGGILAQRRERRAKEPYIVVVACPCLRRLRVMLGHALRGRS